MQTFLPYKKFSKSAAVLDRQRLGKQRVEAKQVLQAILDVDRHGVDGNTGQTFTNHPIYAQWARYPDALLSYTWYICHEWRTRGYTDNITPWLRTVSRLRDIPIVAEERILGSRWKCPWWLGDKRYHVYHRANLLVKEPIWYPLRLAELGFKQWGIPDDLQAGFGYNWPLELPHTWRLIRRGER